MGTMKLTHEDIEEFKQICREESAEELSDAEAYEMASRVMRLYELLASQIPPARSSALEKPDHPATINVDHADPHEIRRLSADEP